MVMTKEIIIEMNIKAINALKKTNRRIFYNVCRSVSLIKNVKLDTQILVGTHHKSGTYWLNKIFRWLSLYEGFKFYSGLKEDLPRNYDIFFQNKSHFGDEVLSLNYKGLHMIRDPRDIIVSGCFYHQRANEPWLHIKQSKFNGLTYQEKINSYDTLDDKIAFEMKNTAFQCIKDMLAWDYDNHKFFEIKYEDLLQDSNLFLFHRIFTFLGIPSKVIPKALQIAHKHSIFSGIPKMKGHIRSGRARQWEKYFNKNNKRLFVDIYGDALVVLDYERNNDWIL